MSMTNHLRSLLRRRRRLGILGAAALVVVVGPVLFLATRGDGEPKPPTTTVTTTTTVPTTTTTAPTTTTTAPPVAPLTGRQGDFKGRLKRPALFVKIDNVSAARPQSGLNHADIVIEEPVEGNLTRLAAVFHSRNAPAVGPVRSVRTSDLELVPLFRRPLFASSGGNNGVVPQLAEANVVDVGMNVSAAGFRRSPHRPAPHNLYSSTRELYAKAPESPKRPKPVFSYLGRRERLPRGAKPVGGIALRFGGPEVSRFTWDAASGTWLRSQSGTPHVGVGGRRVSPKNVVVLGINYDYSNQRGRSVPHAVVTGKGPAVVLTRGKAVEGTWRRPTLGHPLRLVAANGKTEIKLTPGQTFIELPQRGGWSFF
ncbi:MAG TPA: DUF3048 domain-containing protein [Acidimicrobiales bacterium]|jgi:hypothetical protein|nr:DUF3048 domain-containing protein [Acidimicrobiales bacterium]